MSPLVLIPQHFGCLVFDRRTSRYLPFDAEATGFLKDCVGCPAPQVIGRRTGDARTAAIDFYEFFEARGFFRPDGRLAASLLDLVPPADHLAGPLAVHLEVIGACNLTCAHCFAGVLPRNDHPLSVAEMDRLFAELAALGSFRLGLTGGEPLMRRDLFEIIDAACGQGLHPCLTTNGLLVTEQIAREFARRDLVWLNVSLDGATAATNDAVRGAGTFEGVLERLQVLRRHARFTLAFTITRQNAHEVEACADLARAMGAHTAVFRPVYPTGSALQHPDLMPTFEQYSSALDRLGRYLHPDEDLDGIDPFSPQHRRETQARVIGNNGCGAANLVASVSVQGNVNPCSFLGAGFNSGNIRERPFAEIWHSGAAFARLRGLSHAGCGSSCDSFQGGCRARSLASAGDVDAPDPWHREYVQLQTGRHPLAIVELDA